MASETGVRLLSALRRNGSRSLLRQTPENFFSESDERQALEWLKNFVENNNAFPQPETFRRHTGITTVTCTEPFDYYFNEARQKALYEGLMEPFAGMRESMENLRPDEFVALCRSVVQMSSSLQVSTSDYITMDSAIDAVMTDFNEARLTSSMRGIPTGWTYCDEVTGGWQNDDLITFVGRPGVGKAQPLDAKIRLLNGWKNMRDIRVGDDLVSVDGKPSRVTGVYPQGIKDIYKISFADGRSTEASAEHLWEVRYREWKEDRVLTTAQLVDKLRCARYRNRISVRLVSGAFNEIAHELPVDPWLLGVLIGDGCLTQHVGFSSADDFIIQKVRDRVPFGCKVVHRSKYDYSIIATIKVSGRNHLKDALRKLDLIGRTSATKRIPSVYLNGARTQRLELLQGLMDTDGYISVNGAITIAVSNKLLAQDIQELARSLGGTARCSRKETTHEPSYRVCIRVPNPTELFTLHRKLERAPKNYQYSNLRSVIKDISFVGKKECQCIAVSHPSRLYVTDEYVVTHNTYLLLWTAYTAWLAGYSVLFASNELGAMQLARRLMGIHTKINPNLIRFGRLSTVVANSLEDQLSGLRHGIPFNVIQGGLRKSVETVRAVTEATRPDLIVSDASYLLVPMKKRKGSEGRREMVSDTIEDLKTLSIDANRPVVQSVQFNRTAERSTHKTDGDNSEGRARNPIAHLGLHKVAETDVVAQASSLVIGATQPPATQPQDSRYCGFLKGREGESGFWQIAYEFSPVSLRQLRVGTVETQAAPSNNAHIANML